MGIVGLLPNFQVSTTSPFPTQINPFLYPSHFWQAQLVSLVVGLRTYQHPCTYNVTLRLICATIVAVEKQYVLHIVSVCFGNLRQSACKAHGPYFLFLWPGWLYHNSAHYLMKGTIFWYTLLNIRLVFWYSLQHLSETFFILSRTDRDMIRNVYWCSCKGSFILVGI